MRVMYEAEAMETLFDIAYFIDCLHTEGAGDAWVQKFLIRIESYALPHVSYALCNHSYLASLNLSCLIYNDWVVAFKIQDHEFRVYKIVRGAILA